MINKHDRYLPDCFREAVEKRGGHLPVGIDHLVGDLVGSIIRHRELRSQWSTPAQRFDAKRTVSKYADMIIEELSDNHSIEIVRDEILELDDLDSDYIMGMYQEGFL